MMRGNLFIALAVMLGWAHTPCFADSKSVDMTLTVVINAPLPCIVTGGTVEFGQVFSTKIDGSNYVQPVDYSLNCNGRLNDYLKLQFQGEATTINGEQVLKTNIEGFGLRIQQRSDKTLVTPGTSDWLNFTWSDSEPELEAVPVKEDGITLSAAEFSANASLVVDYQ